ncbi:zinc-ribbon domain-containing protein [Chloroflexota bacterium]
MPFCWQCGSENRSGVNFCDKCGAKTYLPDSETGTNETISKPSIQHIPSEDIPKKVQGAVQGISLENTSGKRQETVFPSELNGWNWGAFLLGWIWGIGNNTYISFLTLIPFVGFIMAFVLGSRGNEWAWKNKQWNSVEHFTSVQDRWGIAGVAYITVISVIALVIGSAR